MTLQQLKEQEMVEFENRYKGVFDYIALNDPETTIESVPLWKLFEILVEERGSHDLRLEQAIREEEKDRIRKELESKDQSFWFELIEDANQQRAEDPMGSYLKNAVRLREKILLTLK